MGSLFGFGSDLSRTSKTVTENITFFKRNSSIIPITVWEKVFSFQESWDITIQIASILILQLALPSDYAQYIYKKRKQRIKLVHDTSRSFEIHEQARAIDKSEMYEAADKENGSFLYNPTMPKPTAKESKKLLTEQGLENLLRQVADIKNIRSDYTTGKASFSIVGLSVDHISEDGSFLDINWLEKNFQEEEVRQLMNLFKMHFVIEENEWTQTKVPDRNPEIISDMTGNIDSSPASRKDREADQIIQIQENQQESLKTPAPTNSKPTPTNVFAMITPSEPCTDKVQPPTTISYVSIIQDMRQNSRSKQPAKSSNPVDNKKNLSARPTSPKEDGISLEKRITLLQEKTRPMSPSQPFLLSDRSEPLRLHENPVKKIIKMKNKLIDRQNMQDDFNRGTISYRRKIVDDSNVNRVPSISIDDLQTGTKPISKRSEFSSSSTKEKEFHGVSRRSVTRKEINRILSSHFIKPPTDSLLKTIGSPKNLASINQQISELIKGKTNSASKVRLSSKQRGKNSSVGSLRDKRDKTNHLHITESIAERPSLPKKPSNLLTDLKKKMLINLTSSKKVIQSSEKQGKKNIISMALKAPEFQAKLSQGQHRAASNLLRSKPQE